MSDEFDQIRAELLAGPFSVETVDAQLAAWTTQVETSVVVAADKHTDAPSVAEWLNAVDVLNGSLVEARLSDGR